MAKTVDFKRFKKTLGKIFHFFLAMNSDKMFIGDLRKKTFYGIILMILWKKKPCTKFSGVLISSHKEVKNF